MEDLIKLFLSVSDGSGYGSGDGSGDGYDDGEGDGSGDGSGDGEGYGDGSGDGSGEGSGFGYGSGYGYGSGSCVGFGYGYGYGSGYGSGDGSGDGYGSGDGIKTINGQAVHMVDDTPTIIRSVHGNYATGYILRQDLTTQPCFIAKRGNCFAHGHTLRAAVEDAERKYEQNLPVEERIKRFVEAYPDPTVKVPASELFDWHNRLTGSCLMGRQEFCRAKGIDYENGSYTVSEFINLTINAYGGHIISALKNKYDKERT